MVDNVRVAEFISRMSRRDLSGKFCEKIKLWLLDTLGAIISGNLRKFQ